MTLPRLALESPEFRMNGGTQIRRDPRMQIDGATAGVASGPPAVFGQVMGASVQHPQPSPQVGGAPIQDPPKKTGGAPIDCAPGCTQNQSEEVQHLTRQVKELQGLLLQLAEQQAAGQQAAAEPAEASEEEQPAPEVSYVPRKAKLVSATRQVKNPTTRESVAAAKRLQQLQEILDEKQAEMEALQAEQEEVEAAEREEIEAEERRLAARKKQLEEERVSRLRNRMAREATTEEPVSTHVVMAVFPARSSW